MKSMHKAQGFTLVEIAIVLVIIGLLLGGILKGQEMITQAKIKNVIADFSGISAAYHGYVDRYKKIPGDDPCAGAGAGLTVGNCGTAVARWAAPAAGPQWAAGVRVPGGWRGQLRAAPTPAVAQRAAAPYSEPGTNVSLICRSLYPKITPKKAGPRRLFFRLAPEQRLLRREELLG